MRQGELGWWTLTRSGAHGLRTIRYWRSQGCAKMMPLFECMHVPEHQLPNQYHPGTLPQTFFCQWRVSCNISAVKSKRPEHG